MEKLTIPKVIIGKSMDDIRNLDCKSITMQIIKPGIDCIIANGVLMDTSGKEFKNKRLQLMFRDLTVRASNNYAVLFCTISDGLNPKRLYDDLMLVNDETDILLGKLSIIINDVSLIKCKTINFTRRMQGAFSMFGLIDNVYINGGTSYDGKTPPMFPLIAGLRVYDKVIVYDDSANFDEDYKRIIYSKYSKFYDIKKIEKNTETPGYTITIEKNEKDIEIQANMSLEVRGLIMNKQLTKVLIGNFYLDDYYGDLQIITYY